MLGAQESIGLRQTLLDRLTNARRQSDRLFGLIRPDFLYERPIAERHRFIFYLGHLEAFDWNIFQPRMLNVRPFEPALDQLFAFGIDPVDGGLPADRPSDWPANGEIFYSLKEAQVVIGMWRNFYNTVRPHSALGYRPPAPLSRGAAA